MIDSILTEHREPTLRAIHTSLKNDLYAILRHDHDRTMGLFQRYSYPDVGRARRSAFISELRELLEYQRYLLEDFNYMMLRGVLQIAEKLNTLPYLEDETPNVLIGSFGPFYIQRISLLKNSQHIFDVEERIREHIKGINLMDGDHALTNFRFVVSHDEPGVQVSDVLTGVLGKFFTYICTTETAKLNADRQYLTEQQQRNLHLLENLLDHSTTENEAFAHRVLSIQDQCKTSFFLAR